MLRLLGATQWAGTFKHLGLRCEAMVLLGLIWILMGCGVSFGASKPPDGLIFLMLPAWLRACIWIGTGAAAITTALLSNYTTRALQGLAFMPFLRLVSYVWAWVQWLHPGPDHGEYQFGWYQAGFYAAMCGFVVFVAHIPPGLLRTRSSPDRQREKEREATGHELD